MLEKIRNCSSSPVVKALLIILAFTFLFFFGITDIIRRVTGNDYIIKVGNVKITPVQFKMEKAKKISMLKKQDVDEKKITTELLHNLIWENIINIAAKEYGLVVSDNTMMRYIGSMQMFRDANGHFNSNLLRGFLQKINVPEAMFLESSKREIKSAIIKSPFTGISVNNEIQVYADAKNEKRSVTFVKINPASFRITDTPTKDELEQFYLDHSEDFMINETRNFSLIIMNESDLAKKVVITDDELRDAYERSSGRDERSFNDMKKELEDELNHEKLESITNEFCRNIEDELVGGAAVSDVVKKYNLKLVKVISAEDNKSKELEKLPYKSDVLNVAFSTEESLDSSFSEAIDGNDRVLWLVHVDSVTPKHKADFEKIKNKVTAAWIKDQQYHKALDLAESWKTVGVNKKLSDLAEETHRHYSATALFGRDGKCIENSEHEKLIERIHEEAFNLNKNDIVSLEIDGNIVVYQLTQIFVPNTENSAISERYKELTKDIVDDMYQQLVGYLSREYKVTINKETLKEINEDVDTDIKL